ncbi:MAG: hypothetical protein ABIQ18_05980 [Umezawaea sp.]
METVGVLAHRGGLLVDRPDVTIGVVRAVSRLDGLEIELISRVPRDRIVPSGPASPRAPRRLLPAYDEGVDLRLGWLDGDGRVHWEYLVRSSSHAHHQTPYRRFHSGFVLPPMFDQVSLVLAWPEIWFPETVITLPLPDRETVERGDSTVWRPGDGVEVTEEWERRPAAHNRDPVEIEVESGTVVAGPVVLHGAEQATVVLTRATAVGPLLALEVVRMARGETATAVSAVAFTRGAPPDPASRHEEVLAVVDGSAAHALRSAGGSTTGGPGYTSAAEFFLPRPATDVLDLMVSWPLAGLSEVWVRVALGESGG